MDDALIQRYETAVELVRKGQYDPAMSDLEDLLAAADLDSGRREHARMLLGFARARMEDWDGAIACFREALVNDVNCLSAQTALGHAYLMAGRLPEARENFSVAVQRDGHNAQAHHGLGWTLLEEGKNLDEALYQLQEALRLDPDSAAIRDSVGWALYRMNDLDGAMEQLEEAVRRDPDHAVILSHRREVKEALRRRAERMSG